MSLWEVHNLKLPWTENLRRGLSFEIRPNELFLITGPNGSGKSSLLKLLLNEITPQEGKLLKRVSNLGYLPQIENTQVHFPITLEEVVKLSVPQYSKQALLEVGLLTENHLHLSWNTASGGERKKTLLSALFLKAPQVLLLDEPFNHLDEKTREQVAELLVRFMKEPERALVLVSHVLLPQLRSLTQNSLELS